MTERESQYPFEKKYGFMFEKFLFIGEFIISHNIIYFNNHLGGQNDKIRNKRHLSITKWNVGF